MKVDIYKYREKKERIDGIYFPLFLCKRKKNNTNSPFLQSNCKSVYFNFSFLFPWYEFHLSIFFKIQLFCFAITRDH